MSCRIRRGCAATRTARRPADRGSHARQGAFRLAAALAVALAAGGCLSTEERNRLISHQVSSKAFYDAGEFARCEDQCRRGLEIDDDPTLQLTLGFVLMRQADERKLAEAVAVFESMSADDWRVDLGLGMALQQLARLEAARAADANQRLSAGQRADLAAAEAEHRADARDALERAAVAAGENAPADVSFHLALLDLEEKKHDEFVVHAEDAFARLAEAEKVARAQLAQPMAQMMRERTLADSAMAAERGQRLCRELAILSWNRGDFSQASAAMTRLEQFGSLDRADYFSRGAVREKLGDDEKAVLDYEKFIELSSGVFDETVGKAVTALTRVRARLAEKRTATPAGGS